MGEERVGSKVDEVWVNQDADSFGNVSGVHKPMNLGSVIVLENMDRWTTGQQIPWGVETRGRIRVWSTEEEACLVELGRGLSLDPVGEESGLVTFLGVQGVCEEEEGS